ncbi:HpcH/HpaI aldolase/citrate lyase family protein [Peteryoungia ipomoeae]|uniref:CoA ester lyase n=1 Tax=Peteryoungia ipomoeae TaxID=1210932 RepID=A0A4S8P3G1_9HYPH|nr:CoA ester lyase [Peteryoungia ipomoeae]THV22254.1 CoA ester lyase [Peteryoungia ipomoeae]
MTFLPHASRPSSRPRRSVLTVPAINERALFKVQSLDCDAVIFDLEDSVAPERKAEARLLLSQFLRSADLGQRERIIRINGADGTHFRDDMAMVIAAAPDAVLLPKVEDPDAVLDAVQLLEERDSAEAVRIWAMIETPLGVLNAAAIAATGRTEAGRLDALVVGLNDLRKATGIPAEPERRYLVPYLMQIVLAARAFGLDVIDSVSNTYSDLITFDTECAQGAAMGFDGKMLIHPAQIASANRAFGPSDDTIAEARLLIEAFSDPANAGLNVMTINGRMVERLHAEEAARLLERVAFLKDRKDPTA